MLSLYFLLNDMKGKVKQIKRSEWYVGSPFIQHSHDYHDVRHTCLYAETYDGKTIVINEADVLAFFGRQRFSDNLVEELNGLFHNKWVECETNEDGDLCLKGKISDYLP